VEREGVRSAETCRVFVRVVTFGMIDSCRKREWGATACTERQCAAARTVGEHAAMGGTRAAIDSILLHELLYGTVVRRVPTKAPIPIGSDEKIALSSYPAVYNRSG
jgi:hypothetical protein